jgi:hypothetical protein
MVGYCYLVRSGHRSLAPLLLAATLILLCGGTVSAQAPASPFGRHFLIAFPDTVQNQAPSGSFAVVKPVSQIILYSLDSASVTITGPGYRQTVNVNPSKSEVVEPPRFYVDRPNAASASVFDITSDHDIGVYVYYVTAHGSEAYTPLPVSGWDTQYYIMGVSQDSVTNVTYFGAQEEYFQQKAAPQQVIVIAQQQTDVTITMPQRLRGGKTLFTLRAGEAYLFEPDTNLRVPIDISGATVTSTYPVAVICGNTRTMGTDYTGPRAPIENLIKNALIEWMPPRDNYGRRFLYRPIAQPDPKRIYEAVRIYATNDSTILSSPILPRPDTILRKGEFREIMRGVTPSLTGPFEFTTSKPVQAMVVSAPFARQSDTTLPTDPTFLGVPPAMVELVPHERWVTYGRFHSPKSPQYLVHYVVIEADSGAQVLLDGAPVTFDPLRPSPSRFQQMIDTVSAGDHSISSRNGSFTAIAYGIADGAVEYRPLRTKRERPMLQHPSTFSERIGIAYAYPVTGIGGSITDSLDITRDIFCDSTVVLVKRAQGNVTIGKLDARLEPGSVNLDATITPTTEFGQATGFIIRFMPVDSLRPASGIVTVTSASGRRWTIPYRFDPTILKIDPPSIEIVNAPVNVAQLRTLILTDVTSPDPVPFTARLKVGGVFSLPDSSTIPLTIASGDSIPITIAFTGVEEGKSYFDTLFITTPCRVYVIPVSAQLVPPYPKPRLVGYDWGKQWLSTLNDCTKNQADGYDGYAWVINDGSGPYNVKSIELVGADADSGYFYLGTLPRVEPGMEITHQFPRQQRVFFRPRDERLYRCTVVLVTMDGDTLTAELLGEGIESHVRITGADFGVSVFQGTGVTVALRSVYVHALPTRDLTVMGLRIAGPDANDFDFAPGFFPPNPGNSSTWVHLAPGDSMEVRLAFAPRAINRRNATIEVIGDHSTCDDSSNTLTGSTYTSGTPAVAGTGFGFGNVSSCVDTIGQVLFKNIGGIPVILRAVRLIDPSGAYRLDTITTPILVEFDSVITIPVKFLLRTPGVKVATVVFDWAGVNDTTKSESLTVALAGSGYTLPPVRASIAKDYHAPPGSSLRVVVTLDGPLDTVRTTELEFVIPTRNRIMLMPPITQGLVDAMLAGTILQGWSATIVPAAGDSLHLLLHAPPGDYLRGVGPLLSLPYTFFLADTLDAPLPFSLRMVDRNCPDIIPVPGGATLDSICGLHLRLIEFAAGVTKLEGNSPNPFNPATEIVFSIGLDGPARLTIYDVAGREVARPIDGYLETGSYRVQWDAGGMESGLYYYRLESGEYSSARAMLLVR